jgi:hypothetical protein
MATIEHATRAAAQARTRQRRRLIESGDLVPNQPLRERLQWLLAHDPDITLSTICYALETRGHPGFVRRKGRWPGADSSRLMRVLGMRPRPASGGRPNEKPYFSTHVPYDLAVALAEALDLDPVDAGV